MYTVKKVIVFPVTSRDVTNQTLPSRILLNYSPARESLISDISAGDGKNYNLSTVSLGCALTFASEAKFEIEAKILFRLGAKKKPDFT